MIFESRKTPAEKLLAQRLNVLGHRNNLDATGLALHIHAKGACFSTFTQNIIPPHDQMLVDENFLAPLAHAGVNLQSLAIGGGFLKMV
jgi:hypothetical protein